MSQSFDRNDFQKIFYPEDVLEVSRETGEVYERPKRYVRRPWERLRVMSVPVGETRTVDSYVDQTDINKIIKRFDRTGVMPEATRQPQYGDVTGYQGDLTERINESRRVIAEAGDNDVKLAKHRKAKEQIPPDPVLPAADSASNPVGDNPTQ